MENLAPHTMRAVMREVRDLVDNPLEGVTVSVKEGDLTEISAVITGPTETPFEKGSFHVKLILGSDFPSSPPRGFFVTKVFHPNVSESGEICVNTLKRDWKPDLGIKHVLLTIRCLLIHPNPESALNEEAGRLLLEDYNQFATRARMMTDIHAKSASKNTTSSTNGDAVPLSKPLAKKKGLRRL